MPKAAVDWRGSRLESLGTIDVPLPRGVAEAVPQTMGMPAYLDLYLTQQRGAEWPPRTQWQFREVHGCCLPEQAAFVGSRNTLVIGATATATRRCLEEREASVDPGAGAGLDARPETYTQAQEHFFLYPHHEAAEPE